MGYFQVHFRHLRMTFFHPPLFYFLDSLQNLLPLLKKEEGRGEERGLNYEWEEQSVSPCVNIPTSAIALHSPVLLFLTFSEEKGDAPS